MKEHNTLDTYKLIQGKQNTELMLAKNLINIFEIDLMDKIHVMIKESMNTLFGLRVDQAIKLKKFYSKANYPCTQQTRDMFRFGKIDQMKNAVDNWGTAECGDWVRFYTEIVEGGIFLGQMEDELRTSYQKGGPAGTWSKTGLRLREKLESDALNSYNRKALCRDARKFAVNSHKYAGIKAWCTRSADLTARIDEVFGLMRGATISGTTTDNIYMLEKFATSLNDPIYYLLPIATIVGYGHHTMLEVATPLTLNGVISYSINLYTTLFPDRSTIPRGANTAEDAAAIKIKSVLAYHESCNPLLMCYYKGGCLAGSFEFEDKIKWKKAMVTNDKFLKTFIRKVFFPQKEMVLGFATHLGLE